MKPIHTTLVFLSFLLFSCQHSFDSEINPNAMALSITIPGGAVQLSANPIWITVAGGAAPVGSSQYQLLCKITSVDGDLSGGPFIDSIAPDASGESLFDISALVNQPLVPEFSWPAVGVIGGHPKAAWALKIEFGETYIDSNGNRQTTYAETFESLTVLKGGISDFTQGEYNDAETSFYEDWIQSGKFLTNQPNNAVVSADQIVKLWYMGQWATNHDCTLFTRVTTDNKVAHIPIQQAFTIYPNTGLIELNINPIFQGFELDPGELIEKFEVWIEDADEEVSERRTFYVDNDYHENSNYLFAANSKSGVDIIWLTGAVKSAIETTGAEGYKPMGIGASSRTATILTTSKSARRKWTINSGFKSSAEIQAMADVYLSRNLWLLVDSKLIPVVLLNGEKLLNDSTQDLHEVDLELQEAHNMRYL